MIYQLVKLRKRAEVLLVGENQGTKVEYFEIFLSFCLPAGGAVNLKLGKKCIYLPGGQIVLNTTFFHSSLQIPHLSLGPLKGYLSWQGVPR